MATESPIGNVHLHQHLQSMQPPLWDGQQSVGEDAHVQHLPVRTASVNVTVQAELYVGCEASHCSVKCAYDIWQYMSSCQPSTCMRCSPAHAHGNRRMHLPAMLLH